jgi:hypothetical protein
VRERLGFKTDAEAYAHILESSGMADKKRRKVERFEAARAQMKETFETVGVKKSSRELYKLSRESLMTVFEDMMSLISLKVASLKMLSSRVQATAEMREELRVCKDIGRIQQLVEAIAKENEKEHELLGFKDQATGSTRWDAWMASTYHDEYTRNQRGGSLKYWFVCMSGGEMYPCMTAISSKLWKRKFEDPGATKQKYKCTICGANYKASWGVLIELTLKKDEIYYFRAPVPDEDTLDIKAMDLERRVGTGATAQQVYDAIPIVAPTPTCLVSVLNEELGQYRVPPKAQFMAIPMWNWADILTFTP